ncbi:MAG: diguanylate cyclase [Candidatus Electrothrix sp. AX2]|nr:diguanylate cyclase [Candidatus Electrothrix gigas]
MVEYLRTYQVRSEYLDSITGIANRYFFDKQLHRAWVNAQKTKNPLSLLLCEIDQLNSERSRSAADSCLKKIAECLKATLRRPTDVAAYYEGKKFALLLPYTDAHGTLIITHRILTNVRSLALVCEPSELSESLHTAQTVTISIGGHSFWPVPGVSLDTIVHLAEIRLFQAKNCGGNQSRLSTTCRDVLL